MAQYNAVMIDQPEIFIANDAPYRRAIRSSARTADAGELPGAARQSENTAA